MPPGFFARLSWSRELEDCASRGRSLRDLNLFRGEPIRFLAFSFAAIVSARLAVALARLFAD